MFYTLIFRLRGLQLELQLMGERGKVERERGKESDQQSRGEVERANEGPGETTGAEKRARNSTERKKGR